MKRVYRLENLDCANCAAKMEADLSKMSGVAEVSVNFLTTKLILEFDESKLEDVEEKVRQIVHKYESQVVIKRIG